MKSPIQLTDEQRKEFLDKKSKEFLEYIRKAEAVTGMGLRPYIEYGPLGIVPKVAIVPIDNAKKPEEPSSN